MNVQKKSKASTYKLKEFEIQLLSKDAVLPKKSVRGAIGYDLCIPRDVEIPAHARIAIPLDIAINLPYGIEGKIEPRSGFSMRGMEGYGTKVEIKKVFFGLFRKKVYTSGRLRFDADVINGKVDPNYTDNIHVLVRNNDEKFMLRAGSRIAQITFYKTTSPFFKIVEKLSCKSRGGGLGHTGIDRLADSSKRHAEILAEIQNEEATEESQILSEEDNEVNLETAISDN